MHRCHTVSHTVIKFLVFIKILPRLYLHILLVQNNVVPVVVVVVMVMVAALVQLDIYCQS